MLMAATDVTAQTIQGVTGGDKAVTYTKSSNYNSCAVIYRIDKSKLAADGVIELPATVSYNGQDLTVGLNCDYYLSPANGVKKMIFHGELWPTYNDNGKLFAAFPDLEEIVVDDDNEYFKSIDGVLYSKDMSTIVWVPARWNPEGHTLYQTQTKTIGAQAFYGVQFVGNEEFYKIPDQIEKVGYYAFGNSSLKGIKWSGNSKCTAVPVSCFRDCKSLTQVELTDQVKSISYMAFANCNMLPTIDLKKVETLGFSVFGECKALTSISSTDCLKAIDVNTFKNCSALPAIDLSNSQITAIPGYAFYGCSALADIKLPKGLKSIGILAFKNCNKVTQLTLPETLESLDWFSLPPDLKSVYLGPNVKTLTGLAFGDRNYPITIDEKNPNLCVEDGTVWSKDKTTLVRYRADGRKSYMVPAGVKRIETGAFYVYNNGLQHVTLPSTCESIGWVSFYDIGSITIPPTVTVFGGNENPEYYTEKSLNNNGGTLESLGAITYCDVYLMGVNPGTITVPRYFYKSASGRHKFYVTKTAYDKIQAMDANSTAGMGWKRLCGYYKELQYEVPVTLSNTGLSTMCRDFDVDLSESSGLEAYVATSFEKTGANEADIMHMAKVSTDSYVPSRYGVDNYDFCGVILKGAAGASYTYRMGENDYQSGSQTLLSDEQANGNMLVGAPVHTWVAKTDGDKTNFILKNGKFRYVSEAGELAWNKCYLQIPTADCQNAGAKRIRFNFIDETETTAISDVRKAMEHANSPYYNLNGQRVAYPQHGIYIHNGKKVVIK